MPGGVCADAWQQVGQVQPGRALMAAVVAAVFRSFNKRMFNKKSAKDAAFRTRRADAMAAVQI